MKAVIQRVNKASVTTSTGICGSIGEGLLILLGVETSDTLSESATLARKIVNLRIFSDENGKLNLSALQYKAQILVVSNFTLYGDCSKGNRPSFDKSAKAREAEALYKHFTQSLSVMGISDVQIGAFGEEMTVETAQNGPVTLVIDTKDLFTRDEP